LLSNCSDALEKHRFHIQSGKAQVKGGSDNDLHISITTNSKERTITIFDSGVGMSRDEVIENLGTIAKSGSQAFVNKLKETDGALDQSVSESIIG